MEGLEQKLQDKFSFWEHLTQSQKERMIANTQEVTYPKGENVHGSKRLCTGVLLIEKGALRTYLLSDEGREVTLYRLGEGDICMLSASCILKSITFDVLVDAEEESRVLLIQSQTFLQIMNENIYAECFAYKVTADRFSDVVWAMEQILFMSFDKRLALFLLEESEKTGSLELSLTHQQIAKYLGSAREVVTRMLKYFVSEGLVELSRGGVTLLDPEGLKKLL